MANILDYLDWRGDLTLAQDPFNEVDNLILAELSFVDFGGIVPGPGEGRAVPLWKAAEAYFAKTEGRPIDMGVLVPNQIPELLRRTAALPRFRDMKLNGFVDHLDTVKAEQFAALAAECGDGTVYLSFRGTDDTLRTVEIARMRNVSTRLLDGKKLFAALDEDDDAVSAA